MDVKVLKALDFFVKNKQNRCYELRFAGLDLFPAPQQAILPESFVA